MSKEIVSATGERAAIGGYLPQFDEFAWFVYLNLINKKLEWIRIADPKAVKLDDIQYSTYSEVHAYQVKWTISDTNITYLNFNELLPLLALSWKNLKEINPTKRIIPHLITNRSASIHDRIKVDSKIIGSFNDFLSEVFVKLKSNQIIDNKWKPIIKELKNASTLNDSEFNEFIFCFDFQPDYKQKQFSVSNIRYYKEDEDLQQISRFIFEKVASPERIVEFNYQEIIKELGWSDRFKTVFNHELIVDRQRYQPIQSTIDTLNSKIQEYKSGYFFLKGGPGSGKSTLLNEWSRALNQRVVRYYAFDFVNPSSNFNFYERGNATHLFFDLVFQLKQAGIYQKDILPYKDLIFLKEVFNEQLVAINQDYIKTGQPTIIIIDGLDHVPREYKITANSFLQELPQPNSIPEGVYIILGSQSFELEDIKQEIQAEFKKGNRTILIDSLKKEEVYKYIDSLEYSVELNSEQKLLIFEKSQGHPLYLSYLIEKINQTISVNDVLESFDIIEGDIDNYYKKIWQPIQNEGSLVNLLGLIARINGVVNIYFIKEWGFDSSVLKSFKEKASVLFNETEKNLSFFHNSFKQFLLHYTSLDYLTNEFDSNLDIHYHNKLFDYYNNSKTEKSWKQNYHLFQAKQFDKFVEEVTPDSFAFQILNFRPVEEIKQDAKLGIKIALHTKNVNTLIRYLFSLAEIERRLFNIDPASFTEELLILKKFDLARDYLRTANTLHCSESYALKASRLFIEFGFKSEGTTLYNLSYPEIISDNRIIIDDSKNYDEIRDLLDEWVYTSPYFENINDVFSKIDNISFPENTKGNRFEEKEDDLQLKLFTSLGFSLLFQNKWDDFDKLIGKINNTSSKGKKSLFELIYYSIQQCIDFGDSRRANEYLTLLKTHFTKENSSSIGKIYIADLIYKLTKDVDETLNWIEGIKQPSSLGNERLLGYNDSLDPFLPLIRFNKLLNICGKGVSITSAIPSAEKGTDEEILVEFERMLCLTTQILADGILKKTKLDDIKKRVIPIVRFYYKDISHNNKYWYKLKQSKGEYFNFLISAVSELDTNSLEKLGDILFLEFVENPKYWSSSIQRKIIKSLFSKGFNSEKAIKMVKHLECFMLVNNDIQSRINECLDHSRIWITLNMLEEGEKWLKNAIKESIGVGYRKDYQFSTWIGWLKKINLSEPSKSQEKIGWFLSHLNHIKETTEGRAYWNASEELLEVTFEHNLSHGLKQAIWQIERNLVDFKDTITLFIKYFVIRTKNDEEFKSIIQLYCGLYLLLAESANVSLLKLILEKGYEILQKDFFENHVRTIISAINIKANEETRYSLLSEIEEFFLKHDVIFEDSYFDFIKLSLNEKKSSSESSNNMVLKTNYESINEEEVLRRVNSFEDFKIIIQEEDTINSYFNWSKVIDKISPHLSITEIKEIVNLKGIRKRESDLYARLSNVAHELGDYEFATDLAYKSVELSSESGWVKFYDGGTRIKAFAALKKIDSKLSSEKAFEVFTHDIINGNYPSSYIEYLDDIIPLLTENYNEKDIWPEIFDYLNRLMSNSTPINDLPIISSINQPINETLVDYLLYLSDSSVSLIKEQAVLLLTRLINQDDNYAFNKLLNGHIDDYLAIDIIMGLFELKSIKIYDLKPKIQNLAISKDYQLRIDSRNLLIELGENIPVPNNIKLPSIYFLHIVQPNKIRINKDVDPYFTEIDINDPRELLKPWMIFINVLSEQSGIDKSNLIYRSYSIMKVIGKEEEWTVDYEKKHRNHLEEIYLKYPFRRPRVIAAIRAIMIMTSELIDSGFVEDYTISEIFRLNDYKVPYFNETIKPKFIQNVIDRDFGGVRNDWLERINESPRLSEFILDYGEKFKIIAELTQIRSLDWGSPTEEYMLQITNNNTIDEEKNYIFGSVFHKLSSNYYDLNTAENFIIVIRDHRFNQFDIKSRWIAINPILAKKLGWEPDFTKLFAWKNSQGELMAESIYWSNGNIQMIPRKDGEVGEGWFVIVSKDGIEQIKKNEKKLFSHKILKRSKYEDSILIEKVISRIVKI